MRTAWRSLVTHPNWLLCEAFICEGFVSKGVLHANANVVYLCFANVWHKLVIDGGLPEDIDD